MATASPSQNGKHYCSDANCRYCEDLRLATEQLRRDLDLVQETPDSAHQQ
jgi:hypothetical protein